MTEYHKIETVFQRDIEGTKKLQEGIFRNETVQYLSNNFWEWTEKVDGTNIRVHWDGHNVEFGGRSNGSQIPASIINKLNEYFGGETNAQLFEQTFGDRDVTIFGEGYGAKINGGGTYMDDGKSVDFIMFDLLIGHNYQSRESVERCAKTFGVKVVPIVGRGDIDDAVKFIKTHPMSQLGPGTHEMEGIVCRPMVELNDRSHNRVIVKIKWEDFRHFV